MEFKNINVWEKEITKNISGKELNVEEGKLKQST